jgi:hypothetical protein
MKIDVIDCRGFVKTPSYNPYSGENLSGKNARRDYFKLAGKPLNNAQTACSSVSGQGRRLNVAQPLNLP